MKITDPHDLRDGDIATSTSRSGWSYELRNITFPWLNSGIRDKDVPMADFRQIGDGVVVFGGTWQFGGAFGLLREWYDANPERFTINKPTEEPVLNAPIPPTPTEYEALKAELERVQKDFDTLVSEAHRIATDRGYCETYDEIIEQASAQLSTPIKSRRQRERTFHISVDVILDPDNEPEFETLLEDAVRASAGFLRYENYDITEQ